MEDDPEHFNSTIFTLLKPVCDKLIMDVNEKSVGDFTSVLETLPLRAIQSFQSYICFPIEIQILRSSSNQQKQLIIDLMRKLILSRSNIDSVDVLLRISTLLFKQTASSNNHTTVAEVPEELKLSVVLCLTQLWKSATRDVLYDIYSKETFPRLSPVVFMLVQLAKKEKLITLRVAALECLQVICQVHPEAHTEEADLLQRVREVVRLMFPGIVSCCFAIAYEPDTLNHKVTCANILLWHRLVVLAMGDAAVDPRTAEWVADAAQRLTQVTEAVLRAQTHAHWQPRRELAAAVHNLLAACSKSLSASAGALVCCLVVLSEDEMPQVSSVAAAGLAQLSSELHHDTGLPLLQTVEQTFYSLMTRAPRIMQGTDEGSQLSCLSLLVGYLRLQGSKLPQVLSSGPFLHRLLLTLGLLCRLETAHVTLLEDCSVRELETDVVAHEPWKQLMYLNSAQKVRRFQEICSVLRQFADVPVVTHALLDMLDTNSELSKEIILLLNTILGGGEAGCMASHAELVRTMVNVYLQPRLWDVPMSVSPASVTVAEAQSNVVQVSLLAEGLGLLAAAVGSEHFSVCLLRCLYPLLECAGSPLHTLAAAGLTGVQSVARVCVGGGVTALVCANVDYLSHHITLRLRRAHHGPGVLSVLSVVMRHSSEQVLPSLQEIIQDVLAQSYDEFQEHNTNGFLRVFLTFVTCVRGWQQSQPNSAATTDNQTFPTASPSLLSQLLEYRQLLYTADALEDYDDIEHTDENITEEMFTDSARVPEEGEGEGEKEEAKPVAPCVKLTVSVLQRALHFLPSKDEQRQILVLDILREGVQALAADESQLLPVVHKIWSPLVFRFQADVTRPLIIHRAFLLLCTLAETARDFIRSRTLKQVLPSLCQVLRSAADTSLLKDAGSAYRLTQQYKLQHVVLSRLASLAADLTLQERELHQLLVAASPYLSSRQPLPLQECSVGLFKQMAKDFPDLVWVHLVSLWYPASALTPPSLSPHLRNIQVETDCVETSEFRKNVSELLTCLETSTSQQS